MAEPQVRAIEVSGVTRTTLVFPTGNGYLALLREDVYASSAISRSVVR